MIALIQRVSEARVVVNDSAIGQIGRGILALVGVERGDTAAQAGRLVEKVFGYRIFPDQAGKMNLSLADIKGGLLLLAAGFSSATVLNFAGATISRSSRSFMRIILQNRAL